MTDDRDAADRLADATGRDRDVFDDGTQRVAVTGADGGVRVEVCDDDG